MPPTPKIKAKVVNGKFNFDNDFQKNYSIVKFRSLNPRLLVLFWKSGDQNARCLKTVIIMELSSLFLTIISVIMTISLETLTIT
jgi:hypothetical protein